MGTNERFIRILNEGFIRFLRERNRKASANDYAIWLGVSPTSLSAWMAGTRIPTGENVHILAAKLGPEIYDALGLPRLMPSDPAVQEIAETWYQLDTDTRQQIMMIVRAKKQGNSVISQHNT